MAAHTKQPTVEQLQALQRFATRSGRGWKAHLRRLWECDTIGPDASLLRQVRNEFGPGWLFGTGCKIKPAKPGEIVFIAEVTYNTKTGKGFWRGILTAPGKSSARELSERAHAAVIAVRQRLLTILGTNITIIS